MQDQWFGRLCIGSNHVTQILSETNILIHYISSYRSLGTLWALTLRPLGTQAVWPTHNTDHCCYTTSRSLIALFLFLVSEILSNVHCIQWHQMIEIELETAVCKGMSRGNLVEISTDANNGPILSTCFYSCICSARWRAVLQQILLTKVLCSKLKDAF